MKRKLVLCTCVLQMGHSGDWVVARRLCVDVIGEGPIYLGRVLLLLCLLLMLLLVVFFVIEVCVDCNCVEAII